VFSHRLTRLALPARAGIGGKNHQTPNPPLGAASLKVWANARTFKEAVLGRFYGIEVGMGRHNKVTIGYENITEEDPTEILTIDSFPKM
jgi:hypothetical protein